MEPGDTVVAATRLYGGSVQQLTNMIRKFGWSCEFVDVDDLAAVKTALQKPKVKALFIESLANPGAVVADISALADAAHTAGVPLMVDNTLATPYLCNPLAHGAVRGRGSRAAPRRAAFSSGWSRMVLELAAAWRGYVPPHHGLDVDFVL